MPSYVLLAENGGVAGVEQFCTETLEQSTSPTRMSESPVLRRVLYLSIHAEYKIIIYVMKVYYRQLY